MHKDPELIDLARAAAKNAYAPYSNYRVGAAVRCADGSVFTGCNVENASYGLTMCAERTAIYAAVAAGHRDFVRVAVATETTPVAYPCGACLQVLSEWGPDMHIIVVAGDKAREGSLYQFLPKRFVFLRERDGTPIPEDDFVPGRETL
jgi:cytidine deaminase